MISEADGKLDLRRCAAAAGVIVRRCSERLATARSHGAKPRPSGLGSFREHSRRTPVRRASRAGIVAATVIAVAIPASSALAVVRWFHSPTRNIQCEVASARSRGTYAYCQTFRKPKSVTLKATGRMTTCTGNRCLGNGPENAFTLRYGRSTTVGPFRCTSRVNGMRCDVRRTGRGFLISQAGLRRF